MSSGKVLSITAAEADRPDPSSTGRAADGFPGDREFGRIATCCGCSGSHTGLTDRGCGGRMTGVEAQPGK